MYLTLDDIKRHLVIDHSDDDLLLADYYTAAVEAVKTDLDVPNLSVFEDCHGNLDSTVIQAILLLIGSFYNSREAVSYGQPKTVPLAYQYLLDLKRNYKR